MTRLVMSITTCLTLLQLKCFRVWYGSWECREPHHPSHNICSSLFIFFNSPSCPNTIILQVFPVWNSSFWLLLTIESIIMPLGRSLLYCFINWLSLHPVLLLKNHCKLCHLLCHYLAAIFLSCQSIKSWEIKSVLILWSPAPNTEQALGLRIWRDHCRLDFHRRLQEIRGIWRETDFEWQAWVGKSTLVGGRTL